MKRYNSKYSDKNNKNENIIFNELIQAIHKNDISKVITLIEANPEILEQNDKTGWTALHWAVNDNKGEIVQLICEYKPGLLEIKDKHGFQPLRMAVMWERKEIVEFFISKYPELLKYNKQGKEVMINMDGNEITYMILKVNSEPALIEGGRVLHKAINKANPQIVAKLLDLLPKLIDIVDENGDSVLHYVIKHDYNTRKEIKNDDGSVSSIEVDESGNVKNEIIELLLNKKPLLIEAINKDLVNVLHYAAQYSTKEILESLIKQALSLLMDVDKTQKTILHYAAMNTKNEEVVKYIYDIAPELIEKVDEQGKSVLHYAAQNRDYYGKVFEFLYTKNPKLINTVDSENKTILHHAAISGSDTMIKSILEKIDSFLITHKDKEGKTALHCVVDSFSPFVIKPMLEKAPTLNTHKDNHGLRAFDYAIKMGYGQLIEQFLDFEGFDIKNSKDKNLIENLMKQDKLDAVLTILTHQAKNIIDPDGNIKFSWYQDEEDTSDIFEGSGLTDYMGDPLRYEAETPYLNYFMEEADYRGTALHWAVIHGATELIRCLMENMSNSGINQICKVNRQRQGDKEFTTFELASKGINKVYNHDIIKLMLQCGIDIEHHNIDHNSSSRAVRKYSSLSDLDTITQHTMQPAKKLITKAMLIDLLCAEGDDLDNMETKHLKKLFLNNFSNLNDEDKDKDFMKLRFESTVVKKILEAQSKEIGELKQILNPILAKIGYAYELITEDNTSKAKISTNFVFSLSFLAAHKIFENNIDISNNNNNAAKEIIENTNDFYNQDIVRDTESKLFTFLKKEILDYLPFSTLLDTKNNILAKEDETFINSDVSSSDESEENYNHNYRVFNLNDSQVSSGGKSEENYDY